MLSRVLDEFLILPFVDVAQCLVRIIVFLLHSSLTERFVRNTSESSSSNPSLLPTHHLLTCGQEPFLNTSMLPWQHGKYWLRFQHETLISHPFYCLFLHLNMIVFPTSGNYARLRTFISYPKWIWMNEFFLKGVDCTFEQWLTCSRQQQSGHS